MDDTSAARLRERLESLDVPAVVVEGEEVRYGNEAARRETGSDGLAGLFDGDATRSVTGSDGATRVVLPDPADDEARIAVEEVEEWLVEASLDGEG